MSVFTKSLACLCQQQQREISSSWQPQKNVISANWGGKKGTGIELRLNSDLDLWASCGRPAFLVHVQVFREQAMNEGTVQTKSKDFICVISFSKTEGKHNMEPETYNSLLCMSSMRSGKSTSRFLSQKPLISYDTWDNPRSNCDNKLRSVRLHIISLLPR